MEMDRSRIPREDFLTCWTSDCPTEAGLLLSSCCWSAGGLGGRGRVGGETGGFGGGTVGERQVWVGLRVGCKVVRVCVSGVGVCGW